MRGGNSGGGQRLPQCETPVNVGANRSRVCSAKRAAAGGYSRDSGTSRVAAAAGFAGFWLRAIACFIDTILIVTIFILVASFFPATFEKLLPPALLR